MLLAYAAVPLGAVPRLADASLGVILVCDVTGSITPLVGGLLAGSSIRRYRNRATDGPLTTS